MSEIKQKPWLAGPIELLEHADSHISGIKAFDHRIAFISIDNAVELMIRTFLSLPKRARGRDGPARKQLEAASGFPDLLDLLEEHADDLIRGIALGDIEWFHRIRNNLYHEGNGITVDVEHLKTYRAVAGILFQNLFGIKPSSSSLGVTGLFLESWRELEYRLMTAAMKYVRKPHHRPPEYNVQTLVENAVVDQEFERNFNELYRVRNTIVHEGSVREMNLDYALQALAKLVNTLPSWKKEDN
jgi:hypothetical protein